LVLFLFWLLWFFTANFVCFSFWLSHVVVFHKHY
jgi:hypothetical protein